MKWAD